MFKIKSHFIGNFKVGDNIIHNLEIVNLLYKYYSTANKKEKILLYKPVVVTLVSISEAVMFDLNYRINHFTNEGVKNISTSVLLSIRNKKLTKYEKQIECAQTHSLFGNDATFYSRLQELRKLRNRIHIQNKHGEFEPDEALAFTSDRKRQAEKTTEFILKCSEKLYGRTKDRYHVQDFILPWEPHLSDCQVCNLLGLDQSDY